MFGPNAKSIIGRPLHHHRGKSFHGLLQSLEARMKTTFPLLNDFDLIFVTGSGTMANEIVLSSLRVHTLCYYTETDFGSRLSRLEEIHRIEGPCLCQALSLYETSCSIVHAAPLAALGEIIFADMVSAFPYYPIPESVDIFTTVSSKQLGAYPIISIIGIRKQLPLDDFFKPRTDSVLSLYKYLKFREKSETPSTPSIPLYWDLHDLLYDFDLRRFRIKIDERRALLESLIPSDYTIGEGPVLTLVPNEFTSALAQHFDLYRSDSGYQIFLWSGDDQDFEGAAIFIQELLEKGKDKQK